MEYVERGSLRPYVGEMSLAQIGGVLEGLLAGLAHAEASGIVHRDLKPENLMVTADGRVKIADFGIAKATTKMQTGAFLTATGTTVGTPTYMAPEQAMAQDIGPWTDLYSVGCMAFELFTKRVPFHDSDAPMAILLRHVNEPIPPVKSIDASVDQEISDWIEKLLVKDPRQRTQSAGEAWDDFEEIVIGLLGPRWRRSARLMERAEDKGTPQPLTPAPFEGADPDGQVSDEFQSFAWGTPAGATPEPGPAAPAPGPYTPPPQDLPPGPMTAPPSEPEIPAAEAAEAAPADSAPADAAPAQPASDEALESGFVTFGAPAPSPPTDALVPEPPAPAEPAAPADAAPPAPADAAAPAEPAPSAPPEAAPEGPGPDEPTAGAIPRERVEPVPWEAAGAAAAAGAAGAAAADAAAADAAPPETAPPEEAAPPAEEIPTPPPADAVPPSKTGFETYIEPAPIRPHEQQTSDLAAGGPQAAPPPETPPAPPPDAAPPPEAAPPPVPEPVAAAAATPAEPEVAATVMPEALKREPEPEKKRERPKPSTGEQRSRVFPFVLGGGLLLAIIAGFLIGGAGGGGGDEETTTGPPAVAASSPVMRLKVPEGWSRQPTAPRVPGLELEDAQAFAPAGGNTQVVFGKADETANNSTLLSGPMLEAVGEEGVNDREAVELGPDKLQAFRYRDVKVPGSNQQLTLYAVPTSAGVVTLACVAPSSAAADFEASCDAIANTAQLNGGTGFPVGPNKEFAEAVNGALATLTKEVRADRSGLGEKTPKRQANAASALQDDYEKAANALREQELSPADQLTNAQLVAALGATAKAWGRAASAANDNNKAGFRRAGAQVREGEKALADAVGRLERAGYDVTS
jgi:hypothetical protein